MVDCNMYVFLPQAAGIVPGIPGKMHTAWQTFEGAAMNGSDHALFTEIADFLGNGGRGVLVTVVATEGSTARKPGSRMLVRHDGSVRGSIGGGRVEQEAISLAADMLAGDRPRLLTLGPEEGAHACGGRMTLFFEPLGRGAELLVVGNGHVGSALARQARLTGWPVRILDDRPERVDGPDCILLADYVEPFATARVTPATAIVICTRSHDCDLQALRAALATDAGFIGLLGSSRKRDAFFATLGKEGVDESTLSRIHVPVGLDIGAETPAEIAVSIMAQLIAGQRKR